MLTMDETLAAIAALNTDADILHRACIKLAFPDYTETTEMTPARLARDILMQYTKVVGVDNHKLTEALCIALGSYASIVCKPGHEFELMKGIAAAVYDEFFAVLNKKVSVIAKDDPAAAVTRILAAMKSFTEMEEEE